MPEELTFTVNTGSLGYRVLNRQDRSTSYGVAWYDAECCRWVAEYPANVPAAAAAPPVSPFWTG